MRGSHVVARSVGVACLLLAAAILAAGYLWSTFVWSGGEYAVPPPSLWHKIGEALPWAVASIAVAAVPGIVGVILIGISRRVYVVGPGRSLTILSLLLGILIMSGLVLAVWAAGGAGTDRWRAASIVLHVGAIDAFLILLLSAWEVTNRARGRRATRAA